MPRPPNYRQEKKRREEAQKQRAQAKQQEKAARKKGDPEAPESPAPAGTHKNQDP